MEEASSELLKEELITAVEEGDEVRVRDVPARGGDPKLTVPTGSGGSGCLVQFAAAHGHAHLLPYLLGAGLSVEGSGSDDQTPLMAAAYEGHKTTVEKLLSLGADPLAVDKGGWTALHWAAVDGEAECVSTLIPVTPPTPELLQAADGHTPVHLASFGGHEAVLKALEGAGWPLYAIDGDGLTPLHWAVKARRLDMVSYLLDKDAAPSTGAGDDLTPLDLAKRQSKDLAARWLATRSGAVHGDAAHSLNPEVTSSAGVNAAAGDETLRPEDVRKLLGFREWLIDGLNKKELLTAVKAGDEVRVRDVLARGGDPKVTFSTNSGGSACLVLFAADRGHAHLLPCLLGAGLSVEGSGTIDQTPLMEAATNNHTTTVKKLLSLGADPLAVDNGGWTALHWAAMLSKVECVSTLIPVTPPTPELLQAADGHTPVHLASFGGHEAVLKALEGAGWPLYAMDGDGMTPLHWAVKAGRLDVVRYLLDKDAAPSTGAGDDLTPLDLAMWQGKDLAARWLARRSGAVHGDAAHSLNPEVTSSAGVNAAAGDETLRPEDVRKLLGFRECLIDYLNKKELITAVEAGDEVKVRDLFARGGDPKVTTPTIFGGSLCLLAMAARRGRAHLLPCLLGAGLSVEGSGTDDQTPLMLASKNNHKTTIERLLSLGADPLAVDKRGWTALHHAAGRGQYDCVPVLLAVSDVKATDKAGSTPLHVAALAGYLKTVELLTSEDVTVLDTKDGLGNTPLDMATMQGHHAVEAWLAKKSGAVHMDAARCLRLMRHRRDWDGDGHRHIVSSMAEGKAAGLKAVIPKVCDGHELDAAGLTPLHRAAQRGLSPDMVSELLHLGVSPHVLTPEGMTPADLARRAGHEEVLAVLTKHQCGESSSSPEELQNELFTLIIQGDNVQKVSRLLCKGVPIEPIASDANSPLRLAVILDRCRTVNLLLASGAMLPACLLQDAWQSPDVTPGVLATLKANYLCRLRAERGRLDSSGQSEERRHLFIKGIDDILKTIEGYTPWQAAWPKDKPKALSALMVEAVHAKCPVTAAFLHRAGAWSFLSGDRGASALATALEEGHKGMAELLVKHLGTSIYSDVHLLNRIKPEERRRLEHYQYKKEKSLLEDLNVREKSERGKKEVLQARQLQKKLYKSHDGHERLQLDVGCSVLKLAVRKGLLQLAYLVVQVGRFPVDEILDNICDTTALHEAASHGKASCIAMLLDVGANPLQCDRYDQTPRHLAAMFGHKSTEQLLALHEAHKLPCRAGTTADQASRNYDAYLKRYEKLGCKERDSLSPIDHHDPERVTCKLMEAIGVQELWEKASDIRVDFSGGEALEVKAAVMKELQSIAEKIGEKESLYKSDLRLVGSSEDGSKIYCPDEFDVNLVITRKDVEVGVEKTPEEQEASKGKYKLVLAHAPGLEGNIVMDKLFLLLQKCLVEHTLQDKRLSFVPPCLSSTQVGVALDLAWQGKEYPLLLVGVDLVPVLELPWHDEIAKPKLMKDKPKTFHVSNTADGSWRCSFALSEAAVLKGLSDIQRRVFVMGKVLLSCLKAEPWMPQDMKRHCTWFVNREWKISTPSGFCFKNAFLGWLRDQPAEQHVTREEEVQFCAKALIAIFRQLCAVPTAERGNLSPGKIPAHFGGDFEGVKVGEGAHLIVRCLEEHLEKKPGKHEDADMNEETRMLWIWFARILQNARVRLVE